MGGAGGGVAVHALPSGLADTLALLGVAPSVGRAGAFSGGGHEARLLVGGAALDALAVL